MRLLEFLANAFIGIFGITQPSATQRRMVSMILGGLILFALVFAFSVVGFRVYEMRAGR